MNTLKNKILLVCPICKRVMLVERSVYDLKNSVFMEVNCMKCGQEGSKGDVVSYYDQKGYMNDREGIWND